MLTFMVGDNANLELKMDAPQVIMIVLLVIGLSQALRQDGNFEKVSFEESLMSVIILVFILWWGGFWS